MDHYEKKNTNFKTATGNQQTGNKCLQSDCIQQTTRSKSMLLIPNNFAGFDDALANLQYFTVSIRVGIFNIYLHTTLEDSKKHGPRLIQIQTSSKVEYWQHISYGLKF